MTLDNTYRLVNAIARQEGYFDSFKSSGLNRPQRNNNPGDLKGWPSYPTDQEGFSIFPSLEIGIEKLITDITNHSKEYPNQTLFEFVAGDGHGWNGYAPASDSNDTSSYAIALARALSVETTTKFCEL